ncbi:MAG: hypothetical protein D6731_00625 [Planctomycetota bacterium]|nr:MAG: hypothetical protein D6731_00625 [Planctomycetota bacterium]
MLVNSEPPEPSEPHRPRVRKTRCCGCLLLFALVAAALWVLWALRDRSPGYRVQLDLGGPAAPGEVRGLRVGFAREAITPEVPGPGGRPVWLAGFRVGRAATAVHDDLWAVACVIDDGRARVGIVALDAIGFFHDDVVAVRRRVAPELRLDYVVVASTHNHSTPDLLGLWGAFPGRSGVDPAYRERVIGTCVEVLARATTALEPAELSLRRIPLSPAGLVEDTRAPEVFDADVRMLHFTRPGSDETVGSIVTWGDHPETAWSRNTEITADFPGYLRDALEHGLPPREPGLGGTHLFVNGAVGGLMTTSPRVAVRDPLGGGVLQEPSHEKARALGFSLARAVLAHVHGPWTVPRDDRPALSIRARTVALRVDNWRFLLAPALGTIDRGHVRWRHLRSEVALLRLGEASILCVPGEVYPEIVNGGVERAPGADFALDPVEIPPWRDAMPGKLKLVFGLANDEVGYIIPKSEWDAEPPFLYGASTSPYGEVNSLGPDTAPTLHRAVLDLLGRRPPAGAEGVSPRPNGH